VSASWNSSLDLNGFSLFLVREAKLLTIISIAGASSPGILYARPFDIPANGDTVDAGGDTAGAVVATGAAAGAGIEAETTGALGLY
jgi:hypothetical protein